MFKRGTGTRVACLGLEAVSERSVVGIYRPSLASSFQRMAIYRIATASIPDPQPSL